MNFVNKIKWISFIAYLCLPSTGNAESITLDCNMSSYTPAERTGVKSLKSWIPKEVFVGIDGGIATVKLSGSRSFSADVKTIDDKIISFEGDRNAVNTKGQKTPIRYSFTYFRSNSKITIYVAPLGYRDLGRAWGKCALSVESSSGQIDPGKQTSGLSSAKLVRTSGSTDLFLDEKASTLVIKSWNKWYEIIHDKLSNNSLADIRFGFIWSDDKEKYRKYQFEYLTPEQISASTDRFIKIISIRDSRVLRVANKHKKFMYISLTDALWSGGPWWYARTTAVNE